MTRRLFRADHPGEASRQVDVVLDTHPVDIDGTGGTARIPAAEREIRVSRILDAPRDRVFAAWTEPERLMGWWGLDGFTMPFCSVDLRPGGAFLCRMRSPEGHDIWNGGVYREVVPRERLVFTSTFLDEHGNPVPPTHYQLGPEWPVETEVSVSFADHGGKTRITIRERGRAMPSNRADLRQQWTVAAGAEIADVTVDGGTASGFSPVAR